MKNLYAILIAIVLMCTVAQAQKERVVHTDDTWTLCSDENIFYTVGHSSISKIDVSMDSPVVEILYDGLNGGQGLALDGNDLYIAEYSGMKISKIDVTQSSPTKVDVITGLDDKPTGTASRGHGFVYFFYAGK